MNTARSIVAQLQKMSEQEGIIDANTWLTGAMKLRLLLQSEQDLLVEMERGLQVIKSSYMEQGESASAAKISTECHDEYVEAKKQEVFIKTALDVVLLAKKYASTEVDIYKAH